MEKLYPLLAFGVIWGFISFCIGLLGADITQIGYLTSGTAGIVGDLSQLVIAGSFMFVIFQYSQQKKGASVSSAIEQISIFREKVIPNFETYISNLRNKYGKDFNPTRITNITEFRLEWVRLNHPAMFDRQLKEYEDVKKENRELERSFNDFANSMEEFAIRVKHTETSAHEAMTSAIDSFILQTEVTAVLILHYTFNSKNMYPGVKYLYNKWKNKTDRTTLEEKLASTDKWIKKAPRNVIQEWGRYVLSKKNKDES